MNTPGDIVAISHKADNFCDFLFICLHTNPLLEEIPSLQSRPLSEADKNNYDRVTSTDAVSLHIEVDE